jgi:hypothetical protein
MSFNYSPKIVTNGLVLCLDAANQKSYPGSGTTWNDLTGNFNNGTLINGPTFNSNNGGSIVFDGVDDYQTGNISNLGLNANGTFTVECTLKYNNTSGTQNPLTLTGVSNNAVQIGIISGATAVWKYGGTTVITYSAPSAGNIYTISVSVAPTLVTVYINGILNNTNNSPVLQTGALAYLYNSAYSTSGTVTPSGYFNGNIYQTRIYNRALLATEILQNYNATKTRFGL